MKCRTIFIYFLFSSILSVSIPTSASQPRLAAAKGEEIYENDWCDPRDYGYDHILAFVNQCASYSDCDYAHATNLHNPAAARLKEGTSSEYTGYGIETADIFLISTHGAEVPNANAFAMYEDGHLVLSNEMRLGDDGLGLSIFAAKSCDNMTSSISTRWNTIFRGGLRIAVGFLNSVNGSYSDDEGYDFATYIHNTSYEIGYAWYRASEEAYAEQTVRAVAVGTNCTDATTRVGMNFTNFDTFGRIRDNAIGCWVARAWE